ncbi:hypothetical protein [Paraburkholderia flagellata]|uniref:hypothetical protein n=1 Tax=Paraburkholderia flagellata TaxID=2883241 RepID=UPI001F3CCB6F|nr:hypothetical protein [Paraburkholderia flagellata]
MPRVVRFGVAGIVAIDDRLSIASAIFSWLVRGAAAATLATLDAANVSFLLQPLSSFSSRPTAVHFLRVRAATVSTSDFLVTAAPPLVCGRRTNWLLTFTPIVCIFVRSSGLPAKSTALAA